MKDYNVFALVRTTDKNCMFPDKKIRQEVSDRLGTEFIGTLEMDTIIYTMLDLEQYIGKKIDWVTGKAFDDIIVRNGKKYLPNVTQRFCTSEMKLQPLFDWWQKEINEVVEMRIGFRANEQRRAKNMVSKTNENGNSEFKTIIGKSKNGKRNKWGLIEWQKPSFPLIETPTFKDQIEVFWKDKPVRFAYMNNCVGCFHRNPILLKHLSNTNENKFQWFINAEQETGYNVRTFKNGISYEQIKNSLEQTKLFDEDFDECDSGYCGL
jgi:hypothetical protein